MLGLEYGSDSDSSPPPSPKPKATKPVTTKTAKPKKIAIILPSLGPAEKDDHKPETSSDEPPAKKRKTGAGSSLLMSMLPTPKQANPTAAPAQRVLGGGKGPGLVFNRAPVSYEPVDNTAPIHSEPAEELVGPAEPVEPVDSTPSISFVPTSLKGRKNISLEERPKAAASASKPVLPAPATDFFSLGSAEKKDSMAPSTSASSTLSSSITISAAPKIEEYVPPEPTPTDPYPGYYLLPSGSWAQYDKEYYDKFLFKWQKEYNDHIRALEKGKAKGFDGMEEDKLQEVDAAAEMERAKIEIQEREAKKALTKGATDYAKGPNMKITASKQSRVANTRHQLATMLKQAYDSRELLEEQIAEGRRNRKEAGNKYGF